MKNRIKETYEEMVLLAKYAHCSIAELDNKVKTSEVDPYKEDILTKLLTELSSNEYVDLRINW